jgi:putative membrane protein
MKKLSSYLMITVKGLCMGAADVIPGVSGGTIAFLTGIYQELLDSIKSVNKEAIKYLFTFQIKKLWKHINGNFLLALFSGIIISLFSLAELMKYLMVHQPIPLWSFFFGLIVASSLFIIRGISGWRVSDIALLIGGVALGAVVCTLSPTRTPDDLWFIFISGAIAICAMILPGISGSFILLILGKYEYIMARITEFTSGVNVSGNLAVLAVFGIGAVVGILGFSKFLKWLLARWNKETMIVLAGFIVGSLVKIWPWSNTEAIIKAQNPEVAQNYPGNDLIPSETIEQYINSIDLQVTSSVIFATIGFILVAAIEFAGKKPASEEEAQ